MIVCSVCSRERETPLRKDGQPRLPVRWLRVQDTIYCPRCRAHAGIVRAVSLPIVIPAEDRAAWKLAMQTAWGESTRAANWIATELYAHDYRRSPEMEKPPKMERRYLYPEIRARFPGLPSTCIPQLEQECTRRYMARRYDLLWTGARSLETYRYPYPYPIPGASYTISRDDRGWSVSLPLPGGRQTVRLLTAGRSHQVRALAQILSGAAQQQGAMIYRTPRGPMLKLVARFPRAEVTADRAGALRVTTDPECFWRAGTWVLHALHVRGWLEQGARYRRIMLDDLKAERRSPHARRRGMVERMGKRGERDRARLLSWRHEAATMLVQYAVRQRVATIEYDDSERSYLPSYPWFEQREVLRQKCDAAGIAFVVLASASGEVAMETAESLAE